MVVSIVADLRIIGDDFGRKTEMKVSSVNLLHAVVTTSHEIYSHRLVDVLQLFFILLMIPPSS